MRDVLSDYDRLAGLGCPVGRAVVTSVWGSGPRPEGSSMLATADGRMAGSVSGGCVEAATVTEIGEAIGRGTPKLVTFGVSDERAWEVGLACGGTIKVFVEPGVRPEILAAARGPGGEVVATVLEGSRALPRRRRAHPVVARGRLRAGRPRRLVLRLHPVPRSQVRRARAAAGTAVARALHRGDRLAEDSGGQASAAHGLGVHGRGGRAGARAHRSGLGWAPARGNGAGDPGGDDGGQVWRDGRAPSRLRAGRPRA